MAYEKEIVTHNIFWTNSFIGQLLVSVSNFELISKFKFLDTLIIILKATVI